MSAAKYEKAKGRSRRDRYVGLPFYLIECEAYRSLSLKARAAYVEIKRRYNGSNNGQIHFSVSSASKDFMKWKSQDNEKKAVSLFDVNDIN